MNLEKYKSEVGRVYLIDTIKKIQTKKIYHKDLIERMNSDRVWIIIGKEHQLRFFSAEINNKEFVKAIDNRTALGKTYEFICTPRGNRIVDAIEK